jgi:hypothetical protein
MKNNLKSTLAIVVLFAAIAILIFTGAAGWLVNTIAGRTAAAATQEVDPAAAAAELGVETFLTVDYKAGVEAWLENLCAVSTADGCEMFTDMSKEDIAEKMETYKTDQTCTATAMKVVSVEEDSQIWIVEYSASGWKEVAGELAAVAVMRDEDGVWKFDMILPVPQDALVEMLTPTPAPEE